MVTRPLNRIIVDISHLTGILDNLLSERMSQSEAIIMSADLDLSEYVFKVLDILLANAVSKDNSAYKSSIQSIVDKILFDLNKPAISYQTIYDIIAQLESYVLRTLVTAVPEIDSEGIAIDSLQRIDTNTISINILRC